MRFIWFIAVVLTALQGLGCHDPSRSNPLDTSLTPAVELQSVQLD